MSHKVIHISLTSPVFLSLLFSDVIDVKNGGRNNRALVRYKTWVTEMKIYMFGITKYEGLQLFQFCVKLKQPLTVCHSLRQEYQTLIYLETYFRDISEKVSRLR